MFKPGFHIYALPHRKGIWQFTLFAIGRDWDDDDHEVYPHITYYIQFLFWQFGYTYEKVEV